MKMTTFQDMHGLNIRVQYSSNGDIRVYIDKNDKEIECLLLNKNQASILISAIRDLMDEEQWPIKNS